MLTRKPYPNQKAHPSLHDALREYVESEDLEGVECSKGCKGAKRDAKRQIELVTLPPVLCVQLLRFVYDSSTNPNPNPDPDPDPDH